MDWLEAEQVYRESDPKFEAWTEGQTAAHELWVTLENQRLLLFYPTGKGKTKTSLALLADRGYTSAIVVAPPSTHTSWLKDAGLLGITLRLMSIEKFRMKDTKLPRDTPLIVDEFHMTGKHNGVGFKKLSRMATKFPAVILASATPNYNDADRVYCISYILDQGNNTGGYLTWIYKHCETRVNPFAVTPYVDGFLAFDGAAEWLLDAGYTAYIEDDAEWIEDDLILPPGTGSWFEDYGLDRHQNRIMASWMEAEHRRAYLDRVDPETGMLWPVVEDLLFNKLDERQQPWLLFCQHEKIAEAVYKSLFRHQDSNWVPYLYTGSTTKPQQVLDQFLKDPNPFRVLIGTTAVATGTDGIDTVCDQLLIFDDIVGDGSKRRQLIGRVLARGTSERVTRVVMTTVAR